MIKPGKIVIGINKKVYFEYCNNNLCKNYNTLFGRCKYFNGYCDEKEKYEASKQLIEVSNEHTAGNIYPDSAYIYIENKLRKVKNNQKCKAEITGKIATIIELIK